MEGIKALLADYVHSSYIYIWRMKMSYYDDCPRSGDVDRLQSDLSNLDYDIRRVRDELESELYRLRNEIESLESRIRYLEDGE